MNTRKLIFTVIAFTSFVLGVNSQTLTLQEAQEKASKNYPAVARYNVIEKTKNFDLSNANMAYLPQLSLGAQATWQSEVTKLAIEMPNLEIPVPDKDQYKVFADVNQVIWDGGKINSQKKIIEANAQVEKNKLDTEVYALKERVNNLYFGILLLNEQLELQTALDNELQRNYDVVQSYIKNGVANEADLSAVKIEQLKSKQERVKKETSRKAYIQTLSVLIGEKLSFETKFQKPADLNQMESGLDNRPEMKLFEAQQKLIETQKSLLTSKNMPVIGAFAQAGYGKPALNMFDNKFKPYFLGGVRLSWNIGNLYTLSNDKKKIDLKQEVLESQRKTFLFNLKNQLPQQQIEIERYKLTMKEDNEIIKLRKLIRESAQAKVQNGTMSVADMLREVTEEEAAKQAKALHEIQYLLSQYTLKNTTN